jgi:hypothetical protein
MPAYATTVTANKLDRKLGIMRSTVIVHTWALNEEEATGIALKDSMKSLKPSDGYFSHNVRLPVEVPLDWLQKVIQLENEYRNEIRKVEEAVPESECEAGQGDSSPADPILAKVQQGTSK